MPFHPERAPEPTPDLATALARLAALVSVPAPVVQGPEREAFLAALPALAGLSALGPALGGLLARLIVGPRFDGEPDPASLPKAARKALKHGEIFASADADVWILEELPDGTARISHAHPESFEVLGESLAAWLTAEVARIAAARAASTKGKAKGKAKEEAAAVGKPAIDTALARLAAGDVSAKLAALAPASQDTRWDYLLRAVRACGGAWKPGVIAALDGRLLGRVLSERLHDTDDEACIVEPNDKDLDGVNPIYVARYPKAARKVLEAGHFIASAGSELWILMRDAKGQKMSWTIHLYHAGYEGFEALGTLEEWLAFEVARLAALTLPGPSSPAPGEGG